MGRCTVEEVREIFKTSLETDTIAACILAATNLVSNTCALVDISPAITAAELKEIERWISAHFASIQDPLGLRVKIGDSEQWSFPASVTTAWGSGLKLTPYGQQALVLDRTGALASLGLRQGSFRAAPRENSQKFTDNTPRIIFR